MFLGFMVFLFLKRSFSLLLLTPFVFLLINSLMSPNFFYIREWISNLRSLGSVTLSEANNSSIIAITNRFTGSVVFALVCYIAINSFLIFKLWMNIHQTKIAIFYTTILAIELSPYVHHQDYLLPLFGFFIISSEFGSKVSKTLSIWLGVGLQFNSLQIQALIEAYRTVFFWREKMFGYSMFFLALGGLIAHQWSLGNLETAFALYDATYQFWVLSLIAIQIIISRRARDKDLTRQ